MRSVCSFAANRAVHPHGRGDNLRRVSNPLVRDGSPPRAWGQCRTGRRNPPAVRFTPTGVGTIATLRGSLRPSAVHPHGRGDNATVRRSLSIRPVHPHGRGDNRVMLVPWADRRGSPPRAWGQCTHPFSVTTTKGGSPPRAWGQCARCTSAACGCSVHPHGRGDNRVTVVPWADRRGSPPRAWGQLNEPQAPVGPGRFTPTGVGTMTRRKSSHCPPPVHPHGRGDNYTVTIRYTLPSGSPPRAWGQSPPAAALPSPRRFTPTGVGTMTVVI